MEFHSSLAIIVCIYCGLLLTGGTLAHGRRSSASSPTQRPWGLRDVVWQQRGRLRVSSTTAAMPLTQLYMFRGGAEIEEDSESDYASEYDDEYDDEDETSDENDRNIDTSALETATPIGQVDFVDPIYLSPMMGMYATVAVLLLSRRIDLFHPTVVNIARFAFVAYTVILQLFLIYVRVRAKVANDRTPVQISNPLSGLLSQQTEGSGSGMMKSLASSFLSSQSTVLEYDLGQARSMQSGVLFNLGFMWFLHFKMKQVQPLILTTLNGVMNLLYSPLFQVYVLGRNLERPFKSQQTVMVEKMKTETANEQSEPDEEEETTSSVLKSSTETKGDETTDSSDEINEKENEEEPSDNEEIDAPVDDGEPEDDGDNDEQEEEEDSIA